MMELRELVRYRADLVRARTDQEQDTFHTAADAWDKEDRCRAIHKRYCKRVKRARITG